MQMECERSRTLKNLPLSKRQHVEQVIEALIDVLDAFDGDPDLEPTGDDEPSLCGKHATANRADYPHLVDLEEAGWRAHS